MTKSENRSKASDKLLDFPRLSSVSRSPAIPRAPTRKVTSPLATGEACEDRLLHVRPPKTSRHEEHQEVGARLPFVWRSCAREASGCGNSGAQLLG